MQAMGTSKKEDRQKAALFLTITGSEAPHLLNSFQLTQLEEANYQTEVQKFEQSTSFPNEGYERYGFDQRK